jgi:hypothetical protein
VQNLKTQLSDLPINDNLSLAVDALCNFPEGYLGFCPDSAGQDKKV